MLTLKRLLAITAVFLLMTVFGEWTFTSNDHTLSISTVSVALALPDGCSVMATCGICSASCSGETSCSARPGVGVVCDGEFTSACGSCA